MKIKQITLAAFAAFAFIAASAQKISIKVSESSEKIGNGKNNALVVSIFDATADEVGKAWKSAMKDYKAKVSMGDEILADNAVIKEINGNNTIDVYAKIEKVKDGETRLITAFDLGGAFLNSSEHKEKFAAAKKIVQDFAINTTKEAIAGQRKAAEKTLNNLLDDQHDLEKQQSKLNSNIDDYKAKIDDYNKRIKDAQNDLVKNKSEQDKKKTEVDAQKKVVDAAVAKEKSVE